MTRFARAKGSKASNERVEEEATPWEQLKAPPPNTKIRFDVEDLDDDIDLKEEDEVHASNSDHGADLSDEEKSNVLDTLKPQEELPKKKKRQRNKDKCLNCKEIGHQKKECPKLSEERRTELSELYQMKIERKGKGTGRKKNKRKLDVDLNEQNNEQNQEPKQGIPPKQSEPRAKKSKIQLKDKTGQLVQEGEGLFQGFRVMEQDVKKLRDLVKELQKGKATQAEMKKVLKRERRKAENSLANFSKKVCFQCREPGHRLSECPKAKVNETVGKCYKCGSKDHTSKTCVSKLKGADAYKFADCFVCGQKGHLAKACPDNPKGLYPNGGGCRFCGSVEHLKSECPRKSVKDAKIHVTASRHSDRDNIEEEVDLNVPKNKLTFKKEKKAKVINF